MGIKRIVDTSFWADGKVDNFSPEDKYFMLYLLTNPFTTQLGIYEISLKQVAFQLGYSVDTVKVLVDRFENKYKIIFYSPATNEIAIKNFLRHSIVKGGAPVRDCLVKEIKKVKNKDLISRVFAHIKDSEMLNDTVKSIITEYEKENGILYYTHEKNDNGNENDNEVSYHDTSNDTKNDSFKSAVIEIVDFLNEKAGTSYRASSEKTKSCIRARWNDGFRVDDLKSVIAKKSAQWKGTDMAKYLRPETLFGTKFEGYLNEGGASNGKPSGNAESQRIGHYL